MIEKNRTRPTITLKGRAIQLAIAASAIAFPSEFKDVVSFSAKTIMKAGNVMLNLADSQTNDQLQAIAEPIKVVEAPVAPAPVLQLDASGNTVTNLEWILNPDYVNIVNSLGINQSKKDFVLFTIHNTYRTVEHGAKINPAVMVAQAVVETGYGRDTLSGPANNYFGVKGNGRDKSIAASTTEDYGDGIKRYIKNFRVYNDPLHSFLDYARMINELPWYQDATSCRFNTNNYMLALQNKLDPATCTILNHKGEPGVKSYATANNYVAVLQDTVNFLRLEQIFTPNH